MAYADARHTGRNLGTVAAVTAIEAGLALAVIAGLAVTIKPRVDPPTTATQIDLPPPPKPVDPPKTKPTSAPQTTRPVERDPVFTLGPAPQPSFAADDGIAGSGEGIGEVTFPTATPSPVPSFAAVGARPRGKPGLWVTDNDYPTSEIRLEHEGITRFRLSIDAAGKVTGCTVTRSSGWPGLDAAACDKLSRRAKFEPATDSTGARTQGSYTGAVNWQLPEG